MTEKRGCPHCSTLERPRDYGWKCHHRNTAKQPSRDSAEYGVRGQPYPDHSEELLYSHGPGGGVATFHDLMTDTIVNEEFVEDPDYGQRLHEWQQFQARRNFVQWMAMRPHLWGQIKLAIRLAKGYPEHVELLVKLLNSVRRTRQYQVEASKREALRLATR